MVIVLAREKHQVLSGTRGYGAHLLNTDMHVMGPGFARWAMANELWLDHGPFAGNPITLHERWLLVWTLVNNSHLQYSVVSEVRGSTNSGERRPKHFSGLDGTSWSKTVELHQLLLIGPFILCTIGHMV